VERLHGVVIAERHPEGRRTLADKFSRINAGLFPAEEQCVRRDVLGFPILWFRLSMEEMMAIVPSTVLGHFHNSCVADPEISHPFHKGREMDGAQSFLTPSAKML
jgi:hypothetical protein